MADVEFQNQWQPPAQWERGKRGFGDKLAVLIVKYSGSMIKDEEQASYVILGFVVAAIIISLFLFFGGGGTAGKPDLKTKADPQNAIKYQQ